jgi:signal transduction histidine kinase
MIRIGTFPIRWKIILIIMATTAAALLLASAEWITYDLIQARGDLQDQASTVGRILSDNVSAAIAFNDPMAAEDTLSSLRAETIIVAACVYSGGQLFADFVRDGEVPCPEHTPAEGFSFGDDYLSVYNPIVLGEERIGNVYLRTTLEPIRGRLRLQLLTIGVILVLTALFAFALSTWLQKFISGPIINLARTAQAVSNKKDYSIRAIREHDDELGSLVNTFNEMLSHIQARDRDLLAAKESLEARVEERTEALHAELIERRRAESELAVKNEELESSNRELDDFAYIASHDLKEPLRGIHNYSSFLLEDYGDKIDAEGKYRLETLIRLTQRMERLIDSLLEYSRVGRVDLAMAPVDLNETLADVLDSLQIVLHENNVEIRIPRPLPTVVCDRVRVAEIYRNLITNAMKYNNNTKKWIEIGADTSNRVPVFYVRDNGIGIPLKHQAAIFRIFRRLHARDKFGGGSGAGLTIVRKIVERHSGRIWLDSTVGEGTTFYFTLQGDF